MNKILKAEDFLHTSLDDGIKDIQIAHLKKFAKLHAQAALCTTQLEFEKQMLNSTTLSDRLKEYLKTVKAEDLIKEFEKLGYEFIPIDESPIA